MWVTRKENVERAMATLLAFAVVAYHILIDQYYCLSADDFSGIDYASDGIPGFSYAWRFYFSWEGPFLSMFIQGVLMRVVAMGMPPFVVLFSVKAALFVSSYYLAQSVGRKFHLSLNRDQLIICALVFNAALYLISPSKSEIWHWLIGTVYLTPLIFLQLGIGLLLSGQIGLATVSLAVVMQSRATYSMIIFGFLLVFAIIGQVMKWKNRRQLSLMVAILSVFLIAYLLAPGNFVRMTEHGKSIGFMIDQFKMGVWNLFLSFNLAKMDRVLIALATILPICASTAEKLKPKTTVGWFTPISVYGIFVITHEFIFVFLTGYHEWTRVLSLHSYLFFVVMSVYGFWAFTSIPLHIRTRIWPLFTLGAAGILVQLYLGFGGQLIDGRSLQSNYNLRMEKVMSHHGIGDTLYLNPINYEGVLYFEDFSTDPDHWINTDFRKAYELPFKVAISREQDNH